MSDWIAAACEPLGVGTGAGGAMPAGTAGPTSQEPGGLLGFSQGSSQVIAGFESTGSATGGMVATGTPAANQLGEHGNEADNTYGLSWGTRKGAR